MLHSQFIKSLPKPQEEDTSGILILQLSNWGTITWTIKLVIGRATLWVQVVFLQGTGFQTISNGAHK